MLNYYKSYSTQKINQDCFIKVNSTLQAWKLFNTAAEGGGGRERRKEAMSDPRRETKKYGLGSRPEKKTEVALGTQDTQSDQSNTQIILMAGHAKNIYYSANCSSIQNADCRI